MTKGKKIIVGFDVGGAHLKAVRVEDGRVVAAATIAMPLWQGLDRLACALDEAARFCGEGDLAVFTMTGELSDIFPSREAGVAILLDRIANHFPASEKSIYAGRAGFVGIDEAARMAVDVASANWHATSTLVAKYAGNALFVDMGSTTTDIIAVREGRVCQRRLYRCRASGEQRTRLYGLHQNLPVRRGLVGSRARPADAADE